MSRSKEASNEKTPGCELPKVLEVWQRYNRHAVVNANSWHKVKLAPKGLKARRSPIWSSLFTSLGPSRFYRKSH
ncbi:hypothetical protein B0H12DRAFT_1145354 [Mycena haematopus]|nr:hypothetical protein B0H12DRAFT_1145354 [Mycena haematopus]